MPWKVLGQKWHLSKKGFPPGKKTAWKPEVLEELLEMLSEAVPDGQFLWNNQNVVYLMVPGVRKPWATVHTKRLAGIDLILNGPKGAFQLGGVAEIGADRSLATDSEDHDQVKLRFVTTDELHSENVAAFFQAHLESLTGTTSSLRSELIESMPETINTLLAPRFLFRFAVPVRAPQSDLESRPASNSTNRISC